MTNGMLIWTEISWLDWGLNIALKVSLLLVLVYGLTRYLQKMPARYGYRLWKGAFVLLLFIPLFGLLPSLSFVPMPETPDTSALIEELPIPYEKAFDKNNLHTAWESSEESPSSVIVAKKHENHLVGWLFLIMGLGTLLLLLHILFELLYCRQLLKQGKALIPAEWADLLDSASRRMQVTQPVRVICSDRVKVPFTFGWLKPSIFLPEVAKDWVPEKVSTVFLHELGHIRQRDFVFNIIIQIIKAFYWWHPLVWWAARQTRLECERSCDEQVMRAGVSNLDYAQHLVEFARTLRISSVQPLRVSVPIAKNSQLKKRLAHILQDPGQSPYSSNLKISKYLVVLLLPFCLFNFSYTPSASPRQATQKLIRQLRHADPATRINAAKTLGELQAEIAFEPLVQCLKDPHPGLRAIAAWSLGQIRNNKAVSELLPLVYDQNDCVKEWALLSLSEFGSSKTFYSVVDVQGHPSPEVRKATMWSLHQIGCLPAFHHISQHLYDPDEEVRVLAGQLLDAFPKKKLRAWMQRSQQKDIRDWVYGHYNGVKELGRAAQFAETLSKDPAEKRVLLQIMNSYESERVLDEIWKTIN